MEELDKNAVVGCGRPVLCNGAQIGLKNNDQGLDSVKDEMESQSKASNLPVRARM